MNDDTIQDLKQFIVSTMSQQTSDLHEDFTTLSTKFNKLETKVDNLESKIDEVDAKTDAILEAVGERFNDHEVRIKKLETSRTLA